jgi:surfeit locus 1 family protein
MMGRAKGVPLSFEVVAMRYLGPLLFGLVGAAILLGLGVWQIQRMYEKRAQIDAMITGIGSPPVAVPAVADPLRDKYLPVAAEGAFTGETLYVLSGLPETGAGVEVISVLQTAEGRRLLVDRGFLPEDQKKRALTVTRASVVGNLLWPQDSDQYTPPPDPATGLWFARDVVAMAARLRTEPLLIVARAPTGDGIEPMPLDSSTIPDNHWGYALTWFSLAAVWLGMTAYLLWRIRQRVK